MRRILPPLLALLVLLAVRVDAAEPPVHEPASVPGWLNIHGHTLLTPEFDAPRPDELAPLRDTIGGAQVVGLGDGTHGTHEFFTVKLRLIDFLVREMSFDTIVLEGPVPQFADLNAYVLGADVDPRATLQLMAGPTLGYVFWECEEILAVLDWMRAYNQTRGTRPPVQIFGSDNFGMNYAYRDVIEYLDGVDATLAAMARTEYACIGSSHFTTRCLPQATRVRDALLAAQDDLIARSSQYDFNIALYNAMTVVNWHRGIFARDEVMAENVTWLRDNMSTTKRAVYWGHNGHVSLRQMDLSVAIPAGQLLAAAYGQDYFAIGTMTGGGSFQTWRSVRGQLVRQVMTFAPFAPHSHEANLSRRSALSYILPLRGELPEWLTADLEMNDANASGMGGSTEVLPTAFDAVVYIPETTPLRMLRP